MDTHNKHQVKKKKKKKEVKYLLRFPKKKPVINFTSVRKTVLKQRKKIEKKEKLLLQNIKVET